MRVSIIGSAGIPANYGGYETFTENLVEHLGEQIDITVYCSSKAHKERHNNYKGAKLVYISLKANGWQSIIYDGLSLIQAAFKSDICLVLGISGAIFFPVFRIISRSKIVCNTDGIEWKRAKWSGLGKLFLKISEWLAMRSAHVVIADNLVIKDFHAERYGIVSEFIPYAGDHIIVEDFGKTLFEEFRIKRGQYYLNISRIEPENNTGTILEAFSRMPEQTLVIIGNWNNSNFSKNLREAYRIFPNIRMLDAMFDRQAEKNCIRANCKAYVHGQSVGGTSPALVEALTLNRVPLCFDVSFNRSTCNGLGLYFSTVSDLVEKVRTFDKTVNISDLQSDLHKLCNRIYNWKHISSEYLQIFMKIM